MFNKKNALIVAISLLSLPMLANAELILTNNTDKFASTLVPYTGICAGTLGAILDPHATNSASATQVKIICGFHTPCTASLIISDTADDAKKCKGVVIGTAQMNDLGTNVINSINMQSDAYQISGVGTNHGTLTKVGFSLYKLLFGK